MVTAHHTLSTITNLRILWLLFFLLSPKSFFVGRSFLSFSATSSATASAKVTPLKSATYPHGTAPTGPMRSQSIWLRFVATRIYTVCQDLAAG